MIQFFLRGRRYTGRQRGMIMILFIVCIAGCEPSIDVFQKTDRYVSVFGYLNASADTQFVRVELLRDNMFLGAPADINAEVTLIDLVAGHTASFKDSLFRYLQGKEHNFYTTYPILPDHSYRLMVRGSDDALSGAEIHIPPVFPEPGVIISASPSSILCSSTVDTTRAVVNIQGIERLVAVNAIYTVRKPRPTDGSDISTFTFPHLADTLQPANGEVQAIIYYGKDLCKALVGYAPIAPLVVQIDVMIAAGQEDWPDFLSLDAETETIPAITSNIEGGIGFLGGVVTDTVTIFPYKE